MSEMAGPHAASTEQNTLERQKEEQLPRAGSCYILSDHHNSLKEMLSFSPPHPHFREGATGTQRNEVTRPRSRAGKSHPPVRVWST